MKLSTVILTKNEEKNIERCLKSLDFCDEIIIVDDYSSDKTLEKIKTLKSEIGNKSKIEVYQRNLNGDFAAQRNFGMEKASGEWVLFVDADEEVNENLKLEIRNLKLEKKIAAYYIKRRDWFWGREVRFGEVGQIRQRGLIRLIRKGLGKWEGKAHEELKVKNQKLKVGRLKNYLNHYPHPTIKEFLKEINFYSSLRADELFQQGKRTNIFEIVLFPLGKFFLNYFLRLGFLDGAVGFVYAFMMSFHSFLVRGKLYMLNNRRVI